MCNACGFHCCALDSFDRCGCDNCHASACWEVCRTCGLYPSVCDCYEDDNGYAGLDEED